MRVRHYLAFKMQQRNVANIRLRISVICNHILSKNNELRHQIIIHEIAERLVKNNLHLFPPFFYVEK
jgi:hypothetical protein